jgi:alkylation response protein AidB-like acyl-CoA dehydrogenase
MNFDFTEEQHQIKRTARELLASRSSLPKVREAAESKSYDEGLWKELVELGWPGIAIAEEHGGQGLGAVELAILSEELGYALAASPFLATVMAAEAIGVAGTPEQQERWLPLLASGEATGALGAVGGLVPDADAAAVIVLIGDDGAARVLPRADAEVMPVDAIDPTRRVARVSAVAGQGEALGGDSAAAIDRATIVVAAELVGVSQRALEMTLAYVKDRKQFETPVGAYQAVSHRCAQMLKDTEGARSATYFAAWAAGAEPERLPEAASLAKAAASDGGRDVTASAIQAHGGIGFTWEADVHWLYKRAQVDAALLGGSGTHRARLATLLAARLRPAAAASRAAG